MQTVKRTGNGSELTLAGVVWTKLSMEIVGLFWEEIPQDQGLLGQPIDWLGKYW